MNHHDDSYKFYEFYAFFLRGSFLHFFCEFLFSCLRGGKKGYLLNVTSRASRKYTPLP